MKKLVTFTAILLLCTPSVAMSENNLIDDFKSHSDTRWRFITDTVMGGVSTGKVEFLEADGDVHAHMTGSVSTKNNGGFIQFRMALPLALPKAALGLRLVVRGNNERYFVHLRTTGTILPWQYYQAGFEVSDTWSEVRLPFKEFEASGSFLRATPQPESLKSIGVVAFGRDHDAQVDVREVSFY